MGGEPEKTDKTGNKEDYEASYNESLKTRVRNGIRESIVFTFGAIVSCPFTGNIFSYELLFNWAHFIVVMVRQIAQHVGGENKYPNVFASIFRIGSEEGPAGFFSGLIPQLLGGYLTIWSILGLRYGTDLALKSVVLFL